ncbi:MAG: hypothetical protein JNL32_01395 [Candidatus Kapabacteria bacterium]|nr:hypothetical protein [Candidatus Kapabacteria bacterium]
MSGVQLHYKKWLDISLRRPRRTIFSFLSSLVGMGALVLWLLVIALGIWLLLMYPNLFALAGAVG